jgi:hypothetical protein
VICSIVVTSCGDDINSSSDISPSSKEAVIQSMYQSASAIPDTALVPHSLLVLFKINPGEILLLNYSNTSLILISDYSVSDCVSGRNGLLIQSSGFPGGNNLPCTWSCGPGLMLESLSIINMSGQPRKVSIKMDGYTLNH